MKKVFKFLLIVLVAIIGLSFVDCGDGGEEGSGEGGNSGALGATLTISNAQVYTREWDSETDEDVYTPFNGTVTGLNYVPVIDYNGNTDGMYYPIADVIDGARTITLVNGKLSISIGTPKAYTLSSVEYFKRLNPSLTVRPIDSKFYFLEGITDSDERQYISSYDEIIYMYVDKNVTISGTHVQHVGEDDDTITFIYAMDLKTGWNTVITTVMRENDYTVEVTIKTGKPTGNEKWVYSNYDDWIE
jgi:hypothetical protein